MRRSVEDAGLFEVKVTRDLEYGIGRIGTITRPLRLDIYEPVGAGDAPRPALILAFGGAFHRGSKENDRVDGERGSNTPISAYCRQFARRGYVAFSIDYRLVQEDPHPGDTWVVGDPTTIPRSRVDVVRSLMGLAPATVDMLWRGIEAASDDMAAAFAFVQHCAREFQIDASKIAVGGFSAGARMALNAAYGDVVGAAAVVSLSGFMARHDLERFLRRDRSGKPYPPVLLVSGSDDLDYVRTGHPIMADHFRQAGVDCVESIVVDASHFYPADARTERFPGAACTVEQAIVDFLAASLDVPG